MRIETKKVVLISFARWCTRIRSAPRDGAPIYNNGPWLDRRCKQCTTLPVFSQRYATMVRRSRAIWDMQEPQRARIKRTLDHMAEHDGNIKYDKYTGEIHYDGVKAPVIKRAVLYITQIRSQEIFSK